MIKGTGYKRSLRPKGLRLQGTVILAAYLIVVALFILPTVYAQNACPTQSTNPRAGGLISAPTVSTKFSNTTGNCVIDLKAAFVSYKIPTYEDLKSLYYTQSKAAKTSTATANQGTLRSLLNSYDIVLVNGNVDINSPLGGPSKTAAVIFVDGDLTFNSNFGDASSGIVFVVKGYVSITQTVTQIYSVIISSDKIYTAGYPCTTNSTVANTLTIYGSLISLSPGKIVFCRSLTDNTVAAEKIVHQPKYVVILRDLFADTLQRWSEVQ